MSPYLNRVRLHGSVSHTPQRGRSGPSLPHSISWAHPSPILLSLLRTARSDQQVRVPSKQPPGSTMSASFCKHFCFFPDSLRSPSPFLASRSGVNNFSPFAILFLYRLMGGGVEEDSLDGWLGQGAWLTQLVGLTGAL